eukprot:c45342_g1_i1 orf=158-340(+)
MLQSYPQYFKCTGTKEFPLIPLVLLVAEFKSVQKIFCEACQYFFILPSVQAEGLKKREDS